LDCKLAFIAQMRYDWAMTALAAFHIASPTSPSAAVRYYLSAVETG